MILIQSNTWDGPSTASCDEKAEDSTWTLEAWGSRRDANDALLQFDKYEKLYCRMHPGRRVRFFVLGIQEIPELSPAALEAGRIRVVEDEVHALQDEFRRWVAVT